jgi:hypothetical protein
MLTNFRNKPSYKPVPVSGTPREYRRDFWHFGLVQQVIGNYNIAAILVALAM